MNPKDNQGKDIRVGNRVECLNPEDDKRWGRGKVIGVNSPRKLLLVLFDKDLFHSDPFKVFMGRDVILYTWEIALTDLKVVE